MSAVIEATLRDAADRPMMREEKVPSLRKDIYIAIAFAEPTYEASIW